MHSFETSSLSFSTATCFLHAAFKADNELALLNEQLKRVNGDFKGLNLWDWLTCFTAPVALSESGQDLIAVSHTRSPACSVWPNHWGLLFQFGLCWFQRKPRCATRMPEAWPQMWRYTNMWRGRFWLWMEACAQTCSLDIFPCAKLEGTWGAKMEQSPAKYALPMVLAVNGGAQEDCRTPRCSSRSLSSQESDKSKLKEFWWL